MPFYLYLGSGSGSVGEGVPELATVVAITVGVGVLFFVRSGRFATSVGLFFSWLLSWVGLCIAGSLVSSALVQEQSLTRMEQRLQKQSGGILPKGWTAVRWWPACYSQEFLCDGTPDEVAAFFRSNLTGKWKDFGKHDDYLHLWAGGNVEIRPRNGKSVVHLWIGKK
jgi:hypothetical protein